MNRRQRAGAGGVHHAVGAANIEAIGDAPGRDVAEETREGIFLPADVGIRNALHYVFGDISLDARIFQRTAPVRMAEACAERDHQFECAGDAENHAGAFAVEGAAWLCKRGGARLARCISEIASGITRGNTSGITRIDQRALRRDQTQELGGVGSFDVLRRNAKLHRVEIDRREKTAALRVGVIRLFRVGVKIIGGVPVRAKRDRRDRVNAVLDVGPVGLQAVRLGEQRAHADNRQRAELGDGFTARFFAVLVAHDARAHGWKIGGARGSRMLQSRPHARGKTRATARVRL